ncbi:hypothetical protein FOZ63_029024, partial [Perkinsus olseni]
VVKLLVDEHTAEQCEKVRAQNYVDVSKDVRWCPAPGCGRSVKLELADSPMATVRCTCGHEFCFSCLKDPHEPAKCGQVEEFEKAVKAQHTAEDQQSEGWVESHTTKCIDCSAPILRQQAVSKLLTSRLRADCIRGYTQANEDADEMISTERWGRLCQAVDVEPTLQALIEDTSDLAKSALGVLARSYVVLYFTPATPGYMRAIRLLSSWTSSLGRSLRLLISLLKVDYENYDDTSPERRREMLCIILAIRENKDLVLDLSCTVHYDVDRIIRAGRTGLLHQPGSVAGEIIGAFGSALQATAGSESTIGVPWRVQHAVRKARDGITAQALEQRQRTAMRMQGGVPAHRAERESSVERTRQHLLDKTLPLGIRSIGSSLLGSTHPWRRHE